MDVHYQTENCRIAGGEKKNHTKSPDTVTSLAQNIQYNGNIQNNDKRILFVFVWKKAVRGSQCSTV